MFRNVVLSFLAVIGLSEMIGSGVKAADVTNLGTVRVTATTSDNFVVFLSPDFIPAAKLQRSVASISDTDYVTTLTAAQICQALSQRQPKGCSMSNYPASPGIPSASGAAWAGNGCGASAMSSAFASLILGSIYHSIYSGDLNKPVKGNPSIDFTAICNSHDEMYTSIFSKQMADNVFKNQLNELCSAAPSSGGECRTFAGVYADAVKSRGDSAYAEDQKQRTCSAWGDSMKGSGCV